MRLTVVCADLDGQRRFYRDVLALPEADAGAHWACPHGNLRTSPTHGRRRGVGAGSRSPPRGLPRSHPGVITAISLLATPTATAAEDASHAGLSSRQLRRLFDDHVGLSPKTLQTILRFQRFLWACAHSLTPITDNPILLAT
jgi:AraC-like DNA-binding protein